MTKTYTKTKKNIDELDYYYRLIALGNVIKKEAKLRSKQLAEIMPSDIGCIIKMEDERFHYDLKITKKRVD